jgi:phosphatidylserine/phosphatidylglycerophosphate/cardiolipin synthase-like enzyme
MARRRPAIFKLASALLVGAGVVAAGCGVQRTPLPARQAQARVAAQAVESGPYTLLTMPEDGVQPIIQAMQGAKRSIKLKIYMLTTHDASAQLVSALVDRARAGLDVQVVLEVKPYIPPAPPDCKPNTVSPNMEAIKILQAGGVRVRYSSPKFKFTHEKSMVIDDATAYVMTMNFTNSAFTANREYALVDRKPEDVAELLRIFAADWNEDPYVPGDTPLVVSPVNSRARILGLIDSAQRSLTIQVEYLTDPEVADHIAARVKAGVDVKIMLAYLEPSPCMDGDTNAQERELLKGAGVTQLAFMKNIRMHAKCIVADGERAFLGSENMTTTSLDRNREIGILLKDPLIVAKLRDTAAADWGTGASN